MNYEILTSRWVCAECGGPLRLYFSSSGSTDAESAQEFVCDRVLCAAGHQVSEEAAEEAVQNADEEFYAAMEKGYRVAEIWCVPDQQDGSLNESLPPEE